MKLVINAESVADLKEQILDLANVMGAKEVITQVNTSDELAQKVVNSMTTQLEETMKAPEKNSEPEKEVTKTEFEKTDESEYSVEDLRATVSDIMKSDKTKRPVIKGLLVKFDATGISNLDEKHYVAFMAELKKAKLVK